MLVRGDGLTERGRGLALGLAHVRVPADFAGPHLHEIGAPRIPGQVVIEEQVVVADHVPLDAPVASPVQDAFAVVGRAALVIEREGRIFPVVDRVHIRGVAKFRVGVPPVLAFAAAQVHQVAHARLLVV